MRIAVMQPYIFPYIGYFQLMNAVDEFVIYDDVEFTKKGWINRNRILVNGKDAYLTIPIKKASDFLQIKERTLSDSWLSKRGKILNKISESYKKAPHYKNVFPLIEQSLMYDDMNLFGFILNSLKILKKQLQISTDLLISSAILLEQDLKSEKRIIEISKVRKAETYLNPIGGLDLYKKENFESEGVSLHFLKSNDITYKQINDEFVPSLSIIDVMMFNSKEEISGMLHRYEIIKM